MSAGVEFLASFVVHDDGSVRLWIPLEPFRRERRMTVYGDTFELIDEDGRFTTHRIASMPEALRWLANRGARP